MKTLENPDVPHKDNANARNTLLRALLDVLIAIEEYTHVFLYFDDVRFGPEGAGEDLQTLWTEALIACSQLTARVLVSSFSNAPQSWRDDTAQKGWSEKIDLNGIGHGLTKDEATRRRNCNDGSGRTKTPSPWTPCKMTKHVVRNRRSSCVFRSLSGPGRVVLDYCMLLVPANIFHVVLDRLLGKLQSAADAQGDAEEKKDGMRLQQEDAVAAAAVFDV